MRRALRVAGLLCALACVIAWVALGANRGWTQTTRTRMEKDPLADGLEYPVVEKHFSPGVELLGAGLAVSAVLVSVSFFVRRKTN
jgi:hypothetical protein